MSKVEIRNFGQSQTPTGNEPALDDKQRGRIWFDLLVRKTFFRTAPALRGTFDPQSLISGCFRASSAGFYFRACDPCGGLRLLVHR